MHIKTKLLFMQGSFNCVKQALYPEYLSLTQKIRVKHNISNREIKMQSYFN